jgi:hypothetical protein
MGAKQVIPLRMVCFVMGLTRPLEAFEGASGPYKAFQGLRKPLMALKGLLRIL